MIPGKLYRVSKKNPDAYGKSLYLHCYDSKGIKTVFIIRDKSIVMHIKTLPLNECKILHKDIIGILRGAKYEKIEE